MNRTKAREVAFSLIFEYKFQPDKAASNVENLSELYPDLGEQQEYVKDVLLGYVNNAAEIDNKIEELSKGWTVNRISGVSLAAMRLAMYEILFRDDIPAPIAINEALNLVREFEGEEVLGFVNGILGKFE